MLKLVSGELIGIFVVFEGVKLVMVKIIEIKLEGGLISGMKVFVLDGLFVDFVVVFVRMGVSVFE